MAIFGHEINFFDGLRKSPFFRWLLIPTVFFLTVIPSRILLLAQNRNLHHTTVISLEDDDNNDSKISQGLFLITSNLHLGGDIIYLICGWLIALFGIFGFLRRNNVVGQFISAFLIAFTVIHAISAAYSVLFSNRWIFRVLDNTWENSFVNDNELIKEIQNEFSCKGFSSIADRSVIASTISSSPSSQTLESIIPPSLSLASKNFLPFEQSCAKILMQRFGPHLFHVTKIIFLARFIQLLAVLSHTFILHCIIVNDIQQSIQQEECDEHSNGDNIINNNDISNRNSNSNNNSNNNNYDDDDNKYYNHWESEDDENGGLNEDVEDEDNIDNDDYYDYDDDVITYHDHRKYYPYNEGIGGEVSDELIDELIEKNIELIKFNNSILKSIYYNSRN